MKDWSAKRNRGSSIIELPFALWIVLLGLVMPLIILATIGMRYTFLLNAAKEAVHAAAQAKSFQQDYPPDLCAQTVAQKTAKMCCQGFSGVTLNTVTTSIVITPVSGTPSTQTTKLAAPASEDGNVYQIQVQLDGAISPLVSLPGGVFGLSVPGLTQPYPITTFAKEMSENPQGLDL